MADVETAPETTTVISKSVETKVEDAVTTETTVVEVNGTGEVNGVHEDTPEVAANDVAAVEATDVKQESEQENGDVAKEEPEAAAEGEKPAEEAAAATSGDAEVVVEEKKEEAPPKVILHQFPPGKDVPSTSPFCLKLETYLRIHKIPYENQYGYKMGKKGKLPWIEYKGERKADSNCIIDFLNEKFEVNLDSDFTGEQIAVGRATRSMVEENTYWAIIYNRYVDNYNEFKKFIATPNGAGIGFSVSQKMFQRKMRANLDGHGLGRHSKDEIYSIAENDLKAVSDLLGDKSYLLGEEPSTYDCAVFGLLANVLYSGMESPLSTYIKENAQNLSAYCERVKEAYWADWGEMVLGEKAEPALKKGFSFRKKKTKTPKVKEPEKEGEEAPAAETPAEDAAPAAEETTENTTPEEKPVENGEVPSSEEAATETPAEETPAPEPSPDTETPAETTETPAETEPDKKE